jgi:peptide chain release factor 3
MALDSDGDHVFLSRLQWDFDRLARDYPTITISKTKELALSN